MKENLICSLYKITWEKRYTYEKIYTTIVDYIYTIVYSLYSI